MGAPGAASWTKFLRGKIEVLQPEGGPKFSIDAVVLAGFSHIREGEDVLDLGTGTGVIPAILKAHFHPGVIAGIEINESLRECAAATAERNGFDPREIILGDIRDEKVHQGRKFDVVVSNPPFFETHAGRLSVREDRRLTRHREALSLEELFRAGARFMKEKGRMNFILPFSESDKAVKAMNEAGLHPRLARAVCDSPAGELKRVLMQAVKENTPFIWLPPLILKNGDGSYGDEVKRCLEDTPFIPSPSFFCDAMVGRLAKYLRFAGFDAAYLRDADDDWLIGECERSSRILVTRDRPLVARMKKLGLACSEPESVVPKEQFRELTAVHPFDNSSPRRCLLCNAAVMRLEKEKARGIVPDYTFRTKMDFFICPSCGKLTWGGTHLSRFRKEILESNDREDR